MKPVRAGTVARLGLVLALGLATVACSKTRRYESAVQVVRKEIVEKSADGKAEQVDFEVEWDACPGDQFQVIRGGRAFAECTAKYDVGDEVPVYVRQRWDDRGYYRWDIERMGDCWRAIEPESVGSYEKGQECKDVENFGYKAGFQCSRKPFQQLVKRCPWMARE
ncbi:hypothetical protein BH11MYX4_BH11MYX4_11380 [soil metagenome]